MGYEPRYRDHNLVIANIHRAIDEEGRLAGIAETAQARRKAHFARGGTCKAWIGAPQTFLDTKKEASRRACRGARYED